MLSFFKITACNSQPYYFWGHERDAVHYTYWLNRERVFNQFAATAIPETEWADYENRNDVLDGTAPFWDGFMTP